MHDNEILGNPQDEPLSCVTKSSKIQQKRPLMDEKLFRILYVFTDLAAIAENCPRGCEHGWDSPECALSEHTDLRLIARTASFRRLLAACTEDWS